MPIPVALITALAPVVTRLFDKDKPLGKTTATTAVGTGFGGAAYMLITQDDPTMQIAGYVLGVVGAVVALYKEQK